MIQPRRRRRGRSEAGASTVSWASTDKPPFPAGIAVGPKVRTASERIAVVPVGTRPSCLLARRGDRRVAGAHRPARRWRFVAATPLMVAEEYEAVCLGDGVSSGEIRLGQVRSEATDACRQWLCHFRVSVPSTG